MHVTERMARALEAEYLRGLHRYGDQRPEYEDGWVCGFTAALEVLGVEAVQVPDGSKYDGWTDRESALVVRGELDDTGECWAETFQDDCGNLIERPRLFQLSNPDELRWFITNRKSEGDETCIEVNAAEARAMTLAEVESYDNLSDV